MRGYDTTVKERTINKPRKFDAAIFFEFKAKNVGIALVTARLFNAVRHGNNPVKI